MEERVKCHIIGSLPTAVRPCDPENDPTRPRAARAAKTQPAPASSATLEDDRRVLTQWGLDRLLVLAAEAGARLSGNHADRLDKTIGAQAVK